MSRIYLPATGPDAWQHLLAEPTKHWKTGYSARALAYCWHAAQGFPPEVAAALEGTGQPTLQRLEPLLMLPEHQVAMPGRGRASQTDLWVLARNQMGLVSIAVEGKVNEPFGPTIEAWLANASPGKQERLRGLRAVLELAEAPPQTLRYQLLHRTASALIAAQQFHARTAVLLVHSFSPTEMWHADYAAFAAFLGATGMLDTVESVGKRHGIHLFLAWVGGDQQFLEA